MADNTRYLLEAAAARRRATLARAKDTIARLDRTGAPVTFRNVAAQGAISRSWLYREPAIRAEIEKLRPLRPVAKAVPAAQRASAESVRQRLSALHDEIARLREENHQLRDQLARRLGHERMSAT